MKLSIFNNNKELSKVIAEEMVSILVTNNQNSIYTYFLLASGKTPIDTYQYFIKTCKHVDIGNLHIYMLDEYITSDENFTSYFKKSFVQKLKLPATNLHIINREITITNEEVLRYSQEISRVPIFDLTLLGIGASEPHIAMIMPNNIQNDIFTNFNGDSIGISVGLDQILKSKKIILVANTVEKKDSIRQLINSEANNPEVPPSYLVNHKNFELVATQEVME